MKSTALSLLLSLAATTTLHGALAELNVAEGTIESPDGTFSGRDFTILKDFKLELIYTVPASQGQWVPMTWDDKHRLIVGSHNTDQIFRLTIPSVGNNEPVKVESIGVTVGANEGLIYAFKSLYMDVNRSTTMRAGIYRITDTNGDDKYDKVSVIRNVQPSTTGGAGGDHGTHDLKLTPDGTRISFVAGNETRPTEWQSSRVPMIWGEDNLVMRLQQTGPGFNRAPSAYITTFDPEGKDFQLYAMGMRNPVSHQYNKDGEMFVYDSDMEWDVGLPWYRPIRVVHCIPGGDYGWRISYQHMKNFGPWVTEELWRGGAGDILPWSGEVAQGPAGLAFYPGTGLPDRYTNHFFICDFPGGVWSFSLKPRGASFELAAREKFLWNLLPTHCAFGPDGALYVSDWVGGWGQPDKIGRASCRERV